mgnify:CR=1 FL=1
MIDEIKAIAEKTVKEIVSSARTIDYVAMKIDSGLFAVEDLTPLNEDIVKTFIKFMQPQINPYIKALVENRDYIVGNPRFRLLNTWFRVIEEIAETIKEEPVSLGITRPPTYLIEYHEKPSVTYIPVRAVHEEKGRVRRMFSRHAPNKIGFIALILLIASMLTGWYFISATIGGLSGSIDITPFEVLRTMFGLKSPMLDLLKDLMSTMVFGSPLAPNYKATNMFFDIMKAVTVMLILIIFTCLLYAIGFKVFRKITLGLLVLTLIGYPLCLERYSEPIFFTCLDYSQ